MTTDVQTYSFTEEEIAAMLSALSVLHKIEQSVDCLCQIHMRGGVYPFIPDKTVINSIRLKFVDPSFLENRFEAFTRHVAKMLEDPDPETGEMRLGDNDRPPSLEVVILMAKDACKRMDALGQIRSSSPTKTPL